MSLDIIGRIESCAGDRTAGADTGNSVIVSTCPRSHGADSAAAGGRRIDGLDVLNVVEKVRRAGTCGGDVNNEDMCAVRERARVKEEYAVRFGSSDGVRELSGRIRRCAGAVEGICGRDRLARYRWRVYCAVHLHACAYYRAKKAMWKARTNSR